MPVFSKIIGFSIQTVSKNLRYHKFLIVKKLRQGFKIEISLLHATNIQ